MASTTVWFPRYVPPAAPSLLAPTNFRRWPLHPSFVPRLFLSLLKNDPHTTSLASSSLSVLTCSTRRLSSVTTEDHRSARSFPSPPNFYFPTSGVLKITFRPLFRPLYESHLSLYTPLALFLSLWWCAESRWWKKSRRDVGGRGSGVASSPPWRVALKKTLREKMVGERGDRGREERWRRNRREKEEEPKEQENRLSPSRR